MNLRTVVSLVFSVFIVLAGCSNKSPYSPEASLDNIELADGFRIELVAAEPLVQDPVDMAFDADGRLYVVEMPDYPAKGDEPPPSNIVLLNDQNNDGEYDTRTVFAQDVPYVNGVMPWKQGVLVTNAPDILYFEDTSGDGRADLRRVVLSGFAETNPQLRISSLRYGLDNWIYGAYFRAFGSGGDPQFAGRGEPLYFPGNPRDTSFNIRPGMDVRFRPDEYKAQRAGGRSQFGNAFDGSGNRFTVMNADHIRHVVIPYRYAEQNPYLSMSTLMESISDHGKAAPVYPITENMLNFRSSEDEESSMADPNYLELVEKKLVDVVCEADESREISRLGIGLCCEDKAGANRRYHMKNGLTYTYPGRGNPNIIEPAGPIDPANESR